MANFMTSKQIDIACFTETWLFEDMTDPELFLPDYSLIRSDRISSDCGTSLHGGVLIAIKRTIQCTPIDTTAWRGNFAAATVEDDGHTFIVAALNKPPKGSQYRLEIDQLLQIMHFMKEKGDVVYGVVLSGDFNLPNIDWKSYSFGDDYESMILEMVMDTEMEQIVDFCTRGANVLDLILVSGRISLLKIEPHVDSPCPSDHRDVGAMLECELKTKLQFEQKAATFSFCKANYSVINEIITSHPFQPICWSNANILVEQWTE